MLLVLGSTQLSYRSIYINLRINSQARKMTTKEIDHKPEYKSKDDDSAHESLQAKIMNLTPLEASQFWLF